MSADTHTTEQHQVADKILDRIESESIKQVPGWHYIVKNALIWTLWVLSITVGAAAASALLFVITNSGWEYYKTTHGALSTFLIESIPILLLWIFVLSIFLVMAHENFRHTKTGYKYKFITALSLSVGLSFITGTILYIAGVGTLVETAAQGIPFHKDVIEHQKTVWSDTEKGLMAGEVLNVQEESFLLMGFHGDNVTVSTSNLTSRDLENLSTYSHVRVIGYVENDVFQACHVVPWMIHRGFHKVRFHRPVPLEIPCHESCERKSDEERSTKCKDVHPLFVPNYAN